MRGILRRLFATWRIRQGAKPISLYMEGDIDASDYVTMSRRQTRKALRADRRQSARRQRGEGPGSLGSR